MRVLIVEDEPDRVEASRDGVRLQATADVAGDGDGDANASTNPGSLRRWPELANRIKAAPGSRRDGGDRG